MASKIDVKDKIDGDTMDLSFLELTDVPLRDMASFRKVRSIDLSTNKLVRLPANFVSLTHLVKLDLSKNQLRELPENFGQLRKLRHLDLFSNQLQQLPLSFCELTELKFLDLKDNPLVPILKETAGDCVDAKACQLAAKKVVAMMGVLKAGVEKELKKEKEKREREERAQRETEAAAIEQARKEKRAAKEIRRNEAQNRKPEKRRENGHQETVDDSGFEEPRQYYERPVPVKPTQETGNAFVGFVSGMLLTVALTLLVCFLGVFLARWSGPVSVDNVSRNLHGSYQASRDLLINAARQTSVVGTDVYDRARKFTQSKNLDQIVGQARNIWGSVASNMYEFLGAGYHAGVKGFKIMWKQGSEALTWTAEEFPKWKSEILKKFN